MHFAVRALERRGGENVHNFRMHRTVHGLLPIGLCAMWPQRRSASSCLHWLTCSQHEGALLPKDCVVVASRSRHGHVCFRPLQLHLLFALSRFAAFKSQLINFSGLVPILAELLADAWIRCKRRCVDNSCKIHSHSRSYSNFFELERNWTNSGIRIVLLEIWNDDTGAAVSRDKKCEGDVRQFWNPKSNDVSIQIGTDSGVPIPTV